MKRAHTNRLLVHFVVLVAVQLIPYSGVSDSYDEEARDVDSSERLANAKGTHDKVYYSDTASQQNNNQQSNKKIDQPLGNKRSQGNISFPLPRKSYQ